MSSPQPADLAAALLAHRAAFKAFLTSRVGNEADAEDLLQNSLVKALRSASDVRDHEKLVPWFYQILRHGIVDHVRSRQAAARRDDVWAGENASVTDPEAYQQICRCFEKLIPTLKPLHAELLRRVDLQEQPVAEAASDLGISANNASVTLHRARSALRTKLVELCANCVCLENCECE